jgi:hypothetical protein
MEELVIEEEPNVLIKEAHEGAPERSFRENELCPICGRIDYGWIRSLK